MDNERKWTAERIKRILFNQLKTNINLIFIYYENYKNIYNRKKN